MKETPYIRSVAPAERMVLYVEFENIEARRFEVAPYAARSEWYAELRAPEYFRQVRIIWNGSGIEWPNEQDFSRDTVYLEGQPVDPSEEMRAATL